MPNIAAVILVGGEATRLGRRNKCDLKIGGKTCLQRTLELFEHQVAQIALSVGAEDRYNHAISHTVILDWPNQTKTRGAALGIFASVKWAMNSGYDAIITAPVDTPFLPTNYVPFLKHHYSDLTPAVCRTPKGLQGLHAIWPTACFESMKTAILDNRVFKISKLHAALNARDVIFSEDEERKFLNINDEESLETARQYYLNIDV